MHQDIVTRIVTVPTHHWVYTPDGNRYLTADGGACEIEVTIDVKSIAAAIAHKAERSKRRRATAYYGKIRARRTGNCTAAV